MAKVSQRDLKRVARNAGAELAELHARDTSIAVCFDALVAVLDQKIGGEPKVSAMLKAELTKRQAKRAADFCGRRGSTCLSPADCKHANECLHPLVPPK